MSSGFVSAPAIDRCLPDYDMRSIYKIKVNAHVEDTYRAARTLDLSSSLPVRGLFALRGLPHLLLRKAKFDRSLTLESFLDAGFMILEERAPHEFVMGVVGKFWRPDSGFLAVAPGDFATYDEPGYAKGVLDFRVSEQRGGCLLTTETRVRCTDASSRRKFGLYWRAIGPFSGFIRHQMLRQVKRTAEARD